MSGKVRVAIIGVGNCASSFVQGVEFYKNAADDEFVPGLMHVNLGGYHICDIEFTAAFDVDKNKVGKDLSRGDLRAAEQHRQVLRRPRDGRHGAPGHDPRRPGQVPVRSHHQGPRAHGRHGRASSETPRPTSWSTTCRSAARWPPSGTSSRSWTPAAPWSTASRSSSRARSTGSSASTRGACPIIGDDIK